MSTLAGADVETQVPVPEPHASTMEVDDDKTVVYDERAHTMLVLNPSAGAVWLLCDGSRSVALIVDELAAASGADRAVIEHDVWQTVEKLVALGVLRLSSG